MQETESKGELILYRDKEGPELELSLVDETIWMTQAQMAQLFDRAIPTIIEHIKEIYKTAELSQNRTARKFRVVQTEGKRQVERDVEHYNLDMIISVGYRVNSKRGTQFRIWATQKLRDYLLKGYLINEKRLHESQENRLRELQDAHKLIREAIEMKRLLGYEKELVSIINDYTQTWAILNRYDEGDLEVSKQTRKKAQNLDYISAKKTVEHFRDRLMAQGEASGTFGRERTHQLEQIINEIQENNGNIEEKAANLFYSIIKKRPFIDGNKRIASLLFVVFLINNENLYDKKGERKFNDNGLIALALLVEESKPSEKQVIQNLIANLINKK